MRAESFGAAAASLALGAVLVVSSLQAGEMLLEFPDDSNASVAGAEAAFDTVDVAHLLEAESRSADARREPRPSAPSTHEATGGVAESGTSEPRGPALAEASTDAEDIPGDEAGPPRRAPQPSAHLSPQPAAPRQPSDGERRLPESSAPAPRIRALSESSLSSRLVAVPEPEPSARNAGPSTRDDRAPGRSPVPGRSPRAAAPSAERRSPERAVATPPADAPVPADTRETVERGADTADERVSPASRSTSGLRLHVGQPATGDRDAVPPPEATARAVGEAAHEEAEQAERADAKAEKPEPEKAAPEETEPEKTEKATPDEAAKATPRKPEAERAEPGRPTVEPATPATPATPAEPKPGAGQPDRPPRDPPPAEPATPAIPATPAHPAAEPADGRGPAHQATSADR